MTQDLTLGDKADDKPTRGIIAIIALALVVRAVVVVAALRDLAIPRSTDDYVGMAQAWLEAGLYTKMEWPPVYLSVCRVFLVWFGPDAVFHVLLVMHVVLGAASVYLTYLIARRLGLGGRAGLLAAGIVAVEPSIVIHTGLALTETLYVFLLLAGIHLTLLAREAGSRRSVVVTSLGAGALLGLASLARYIGLPVALGLVVWVAVARSDTSARSRIRRAAAIMALVAAANLGWMTRNLIDMGHFELNSAGGHNFAVMWVGPARVMYEGYPVDSYNCLWIWQQDSGPDWYSNDKFTQAKATGRAATRWALSHPFALVQGLIRSAGLLWLGPGRGPWEKITGVEPLPHWLTGLLYAWHFLFAALTVAGLPLWWNARRDCRAGLALVVLVIAAHQISLGCSGYNRYLVPIVPFASMLVAVAIIDGRRWVRGLMGQARETGWIVDDIETQQPEPARKPVTDGEGADLGDLLTRIQGPVEEEDDDG